jgi:hypothetical protein
MRSAFAKEKAAEAARDEEHVQHVHKLNRHPALVLNADYQVCTFVVRCKLKRRRLIDDSYPRVLLLLLTSFLLCSNHQPISYLPLSMWHWQEAIKAVFSGKVTVVDVYPDVTIRAANLEIPLPSVIALNEYVPQPNSVRSYCDLMIQSCDERLDSPYISITQCTETSLYQTQRLSPG